MWPYVIHDLVIRYDLCNLRCQYCGLTVEDVPRMVRRGHTVGLKAGNGIRSAEHVQAVVTRVKTLVSHIRQHCDYPLLKVSGGELSVIPEWVNMVIDFAHELPAVQLLTNGTGLSREQVERLSTLPNFVVQLSLDGHTAVANSYRGLNQRQVDRTLAMVDYFVNHGVGVEINMVLTRVNIDALPEFATWAAQTAAGCKGNLMLSPRPVRGVGAEETRAGSEASRLWEGVCKAPPEVMMPQTYLERIFHVLNSGARDWSCYVPYYVVGTRDSGDIDICTCGPHLGEAGTLPDDISYLDQGSHYDPDSSPLVCSDCITHYEAFNLFYHGLLGEAELACIPSLSLPMVMEGVRKTTATLKNHLSRLTPTPPVGPTASQGFVV